MNEFETQTGLERDRKRKRETNRQIKTEQNREGMCQWTFMINFDLTFIISVKLNFFI